MHAGPSSSSMAAAAAPKVFHNGTCYIVAEEGEYELKVKVLNATQDQLYKAHMQLDGEDIGYYKTIVTERKHTDAEGIFHGFAKTAANGSVSFRAFRFGACKPSAGAPTVDHPDQIQAGRIEVHVDAVVKVGEYDPYPVAEHQPSNDAAREKLPEGKKWFLQPGLKAEVGSTVTHSSSGWLYDKYHTVRVLPVAKLRYDTAENLLLRNILKRSDPVHRLILRNSRNERVAALGFGSSRHRAAVGAKRGQDQQQRYEDEEDEDDHYDDDDDDDDEDDGDGDEEEEGNDVIPRSATAETINLVGDSGRRPIKVGGRALAADELAVCDLCDDDEAPRWKVAKKQAIELR